MPVFPDISKPVIIWQQPEDYRLSKGSDLLIEVQLCNVDTDALVQTIPIQFSNKTALFNQLDILSHLEEGWDGFNAIPPCSEAISNASKFLSRISVDFIEKITLEDIYPTNHGTVVIDLINQNNEKVSVEFGRTKIGFYTDFKSGQNYRLDSVSYNYNNFPPDLISAVTQLYKSYIF